MAFSLSTPQVRLSRSNPKWKIGNINHFCTDVNDLTVTCVSGVSYVQYSWPTHPCSTCRQQQEHEPALTNPKHDRDRDSRAILTTCVVLCYSLERSGIDRRGMKVHFLSTLMDLDEDRRQGKSTMHKRNGRSSQRQMSYDFRDSGSDSLPPWYQQWICRCLWEHPAAIGATVV